MGKRKASTPPEMLNGRMDSDDEDVTRVHKFNSGASTPKRRLPSVSPNKLFFTQSNSSNPSSKFKNLADIFSSKMTNLNDSFIKTCERAVKRQRDTCLAPLLKDYLYHTTVLIESCQTTNTQFPSVQRKGSKCEKSFKLLGSYFESLDKVCAKRGGILLNTNAPAVAGNNSVSSYNLTTKPSATVSNTSGVLSAENIYKFQNKVPSTDKNSKVEAIKQIPTKPANSHPFASFNFGPVVASTNPTFSFGKPASDTNSVKKGLGFGSPIGSCTPLPNTNTPPMTFSLTNGFTVQGLNGPLSSGMNGILSKTPSTTGQTFASSGFSFTSSINAAKSTESDKTDIKEDDEDEEPPKNEFKPVVESDALFSARCKLFGMIGGQFKDKGVGQLYVKKLESGKYQAVVRADNSLGTIILNLLLQSGLPLKKKSAKDVMTVDPTGDNGKPMTVLIRVKSEAEATDLLEKLKNFADMSS